MLTQAELESETYSFGRERIAKSIAKNEERGRADDNPYAQAVYRRFVLPLAERIRQEVATLHEPGRRRAFVALLAHMDPDATAFVAVRALLTAAINPPKDGSDRKIVTGVGRAVYHEHLLSAFADAHPALFHHMLHDLDRRMSNDERHRMSVMRITAKRKGIEFQEWDTSQREQVGAWLVETMESLGMVTVGTASVAEDGRVKHQYHIRLTDSVTKVISSVTDFVVENTPYFLPCVERPRDWVSVDDGGFHTQEMRRLMPYVVKSHPLARDSYVHADMTEELAAVNHMQGVRFRINNRLLDIVNDIAGEVETDDMVGADAGPEPVRPDFLDRLEPDQLDGEQREEFKKWKREMAEWHTAHKAKAYTYGKFCTIMRTARKFRDYPNLHFVYFLDFRSRKYAMTTGVSPQGSDLQKALLEFAIGKPLLSEDAKRWFMITGANRFGFDKATLDNRVKWVRDNHDVILACAADPKNRRDWTAADKPLQFLAWCLEYSDWVRLGDSFKSRVSVGMDGSCNGLQNFSAMLRDKVGGRATNLLPPLSPYDVPNDIYGDVATRTTHLLQCAQDDDAGLRKLWLAHGITRNLVKRSVMTLPYGAKRQSCAKFILGDYIKAGKFPELPKNLHKAASQYLSGFVWAAIGETVVKAREAMDYLQRASRLILQSGQPFVRWLTPTGFPVVQVYQEEKVHRINARLCGDVKLRLNRETDDPSINEHRNGIAPNVVHSLDASHLTRVVCACREHGIDSLVLVHDDFGTHAADSAALFRIIREEFVRMYTQHDPLGEFQTAYPILPDPPAYGDMDINDVLQSPYFFA